MITLTKETVKKMQYLIKKTKTLYRYEIEYTTVDSVTSLTLLEYPVIRETEHSYFIYPTAFQKEKRIRKNAMNTYAYPTKKEAREHFIRRTENRVKWFEFWIKECKRGIRLMKQLQFDEPINESNK